ncbi:MAG: DHHW family protein [Oscillospiraceae bacterium]
MIKFLTLNRKIDGHNSFCPSSKFGKIFLCTICALAVSLLSILSIFDVDATVSQSENRSLAAAPKLTISAVFDKSFTADFDEYYADTFPFREFFLNANKKISKVLSGTKGTDDIVLVEKSDKDDFAGQDID